VAARQEVRDPLDVRGGEHLAEELELGAARGAIARGNREDGAVVLDDAEPAVVERDELCEVAVLVEDRGELLNLLDQRAIDHAHLRPLDASHATTFEHAREQLGGLLLELREQIDRERRVAAREQSVALVAQAVEVVRTTGAASHLAVVDQVVRRQTGVRSPVVAVTKDRRYDATGTDDPALRGFIEYWLGRE